MGCRTLFLRCSKQAFFVTNYRSSDNKCLELKLINLSFGKASKMILRLLTRSFPWTFCSNLQKWCMHVVALHVNQDLWKTRIQHILQICFIVKLVSSSTQLKDKNGEIVRKTIVVTLIILHHPFFAVAVLTLHCWCYRHCKGPPIPALCLILTVNEFCSMRNYVKIYSKIVLFRRYRT